MESRKEESDRVDVATQFRLETQLGDGFGGGEVR